VRAEWEYWNLSSECHGTPRAGSQCLRASTWIGIVDLNVISRCEHALRCTDHIASLLSGPRLTQSLLAPPATIPKWPSCQRPLDPILLAPRKNSLSVEQQCIPLRARDSRVVPHACVQTSLSPRPLQRARADGQSGPRGGMTGNFRLIKLMGSLFVAPTRRWAPHCLRRPLAAITRAGSVIQEPGALSRDPSLA